MRWSNRNIRLTLLYVIIGAIIIWLAPREINWSPSFSEHHKSPLGLFVLNEQWSDLFESVQYANKTVHSVLADTQYTGHNYILINDHIQLDALDIEALLDFIEQGNNVFISSETVNDTLINGIFGLESSYAYQFFQPFKITMKDSIEQYLSVPYKRDTVRLGIYNRWLGRHYVQDTARQAYDSLGFFDQDKLNFVSTSIGSGNLFLHGAPAVFTNYALLYGDSRSYVSHVLSVLPNAPTIIDSYYKSGIVRRNASPLTMIMRNKPLRLAYYILLATVVIFMIFESKRRQRIIPIIKPYANQFIEYVRTISGLHFNRRENKNIALKRITGLKQLLHAEFYMKNIEFSTDQITDFAQWTDYPEEDWKTLIYHINNVEKTEKLTDHGLLQFNKELNAFYKAIKH